MDFEEKPLRPAHKPQQMNSETESRQKTEADLLDDDNPYLLLGATTPEPSKPTPELSKLYQLDKKISSGVGQIYNLARSGIGKLEKEKNEEGSLWNEL